MTVLVKHGPHMRSLRARERIEKLAFEPRLSSSTLPLWFTFLPLFTWRGSTFDEDRNTVLC